MRASRRKGGDYGTQEQEDDANDMDDEQEADRSTL
jgi:hypothetical protein